MTENRLSIDEYLTIAEKSEMRLELVNSAVRECPMLPFKFAVDSASVCSELVGYAMQTEHGYVSSPKGGYIISPDNVFLPNCAYISKDQVPDLDGILFPVAPDLAIQIIAPGENSRFVLDRAWAYLKTRTKMMWAVYPDDQVVDVHRLAADGRMILETFTIEATLDGRDVLPGFTLPVSSIFRASSSLR